MSTIIKPERKLHVTTAFELRGYWIGYVVYSTFDYVESKRHFFDTVQGCADFIEINYPGVPVYYDVRPKHPTNSTRL